MITRSGRGGIPPNASWTSASLARNPRAPSAAWSRARSGASGFPSTATDHARPPRPASLNPPLARRSVAARSEGSRRNRFPRTSNTRSPDHREHAPPGTDEPAEPAATPPMNPPPPPPPSARRSLAGPPATSRGSVSSWFLASRNSSSATHPFPKHPTPSRASLRRFPLASRCVSAGLCFRAAGSRVRAFSETLSRFRFASVAPPNRSETNLKKFSPTSSVSSALAASRPSGSSSNPHPRHHTSLSSGWYRPRSFGSAVRSGFRHRSIVSSRGHDVARSPGRASSALALRISRLSARRPSNDAPTRRNRFPPASSVSRNGSFEPIPSGSVRSSFRSTSRCARHGMVSGRSSGSAARRLRLSASRETPRNFWSITRGGSVASPRRRRRSSVVRAAASGDVRSNHDRTALGVVASRRSFAACAGSEETLRSETAAFSAVLRRSREGRSKRSFEASSKRFAAAGRSSAHSALPWYAPRSHRAQFPAPTTTPRSPRRRPRSSPRRSSAATYARWSFASATVGGASARRASAPPSRSNASSAAHVDSVALRASRRASSALAASRSARRAEARSSAAARTTRRVRSRRRSRASAATRSFSRTSAARAASARASSSRRRSSSRARGSGARGGEGRGATALLLPEGAAPAPPGGGIRLGRDETPACERRRREGRDGSRGGGARRRVAVRSRRRRDRERGRVGRRGRARGRDRRAHRAPRGATAPSRCEDANDEIRR